MKRILGKYEIIERLGRGGMAEVYKAYHPNLDRYVAIKILHKFLAEDAEFKIRFEREAQNIARLKHANIVQVYDFDYDPVDESYYMVMELIVGETLKDRMMTLERAGQKMPLEEALRITREAAGALSYAHRAGMIHRDVKPGNLMIEASEDSRIVLTDFGIAKIVTGSQFTVTGGLIGTPAYMAPEQGVGETGDERSDLYSLGVIFYQMLTDELPYDADTPLALVLKHVNEAIPSAHMANTALPVQVDDIIERLMAKDPDQRYQNANELIEDLSAFEEDLKAGAVSLVSSPPPVVTLPPLSPRQPKVGGDTERPTVRLMMQDSKPATWERPPSNTRAKGPNWSLLLLILLIGTGILGGGYLYGARQGWLPSFGLLASPTPTPTTPAPSATAADTPTFTLTPTTRITRTPTSTATSTTTPTNTPRPTTAVPTDTDTPRPSPTATDQNTGPTIVTQSSPTPAPTVDTTATRAIELSATMAECSFNYAIIEQLPEEGEDGGEFVTNTAYERTIRLLNTGTCGWERNTSLTFVTGSGEDFDAGPRIFIREVVPVGSEVEVQFSGRTPAAGRLEAGRLVPVGGQWQLLTPGQLRIGEPFTISVLVFDPGG